MVGGVPSSRLVHSIQLRNSIIRIEEVFHYVGEGILQDPGGLDHSAEVFRFYVRFHIITLEPAVKRLAGERFRIGAGCPSIVMNGRMKRLRSVCDIVSHYSRRIDYVLLDLRAL